MVMALARQVVGPLPASTSSAVAAVEVASGEVAVVASATLGREMLPESIIVASVPVLAVAEDHHL